MTESRLGHDSPAVQKHVEMLQGVITRTSENSRSCKLWCVTLVAAILVLVARTGMPQHVLIALVPTFLFFVLDAYYLALERAFREAYNRSVDKLARGELTAAEVYRVTPTGMGIGLVVRCMGSFSVWLFYPLVLATIALAWLCIFLSY